MTRYAIILTVLALAFGVGTAQARTVTLSWVVKHCSVKNSWCGWQSTVNCENSGHWYETPGSFWYGVQFESGSMTTAQQHTGVRVSAWPPSQIVNAIWLRNNSQGDPWPNCPQPYTP